MTTEQIQAMADTCVKAAKNAYGVELDYSLGSLAGLEEVFQSMQEEHARKPIDEPGLNARCIALGAYVGEVIRRIVGGRWEGESLVLPFSGNLSPISWAHKRIVSGPGDNVEFKAKVLISLEQNKGAPLNAPH